VMRRPEKKNALNDEMFRAMSEAINSAQSVPDRRCLILTGRSGVFTAGEDISDFADGSAAKRDEAKPRDAIGFLRALVNNKKRSSPRSMHRGRHRHDHGAALRRCDRGTTSSFLSPFVSTGLVPEGASSLLLPLMGRSSARVRDAGDGTADERRGRPTTLEWSTSLSHRAMPSSKRRKSRARFRLARRSGRDFAEAPEAADRGSAAQNGARRALFRDG